MSNRERPPNMIGRRVLKEKLSDHYLLFRFCLPGVLAANVSARRTHLDLCNAGIQTLDCIQDRVEFFIGAFIHR